MKIISLRSLLLFLLAIPCAGAVKANEYAFNDRCERSCYECRCEPLYECSWGIQFTAGVRPILWRNRDHFYAVNCLADTALNDIGQLPKFHKLYRLPWQVGAQVSYATSTNTNLFFEFNYASAQAKSDLVALGTSALTFNTVGRYKLYEGYAGARYYFDRWFCNTVSFFLGAKLGFIHHKSVEASFAPVSDGVLCYTNYGASDYSLFRKNNVFAGGGQLGLDICLNGAWTLVITAEVLADCGPKSAGNLGVCSYDSLILNDASAVFVPGCTELAFPVTFGFKYNF